MRSSFVITASAQSMFVVDIKHACSSQFLGLRQPTQTLSERSYFGQRENAMP